MACISAGALKAGVVDTYFMNLAYGYRDYGVPYCFISSWVNKGISKPDNYTRGYITGRFDKGELGGRSTYSPEKKKTVDGSNIIFVQLESFMDPETIKGYSFSQDPIPNFRKMKKKYSSGIFRVPVVGAGTANTEFEAITGISAKFFGPGEYPALLHQAFAHCARFPKKGVLRDPRAGARPIRPGAFLLASNLILCGELDEFLFGILFSPAVVPSLNDSFHPSKIGRASCRERV